ncbi:hypothetical protein JG687_00000602 [Phytophthora cactorum]|uniref:Uncharacterized protein n=2 Tax=Phytophthora cactorum TaxID=29920 RepID=A0A329SPS8_9STRA|nr:hypothetical protein JG687_00000602 [Phytophthora cactorum]RAW38605.1 hypothetical protein PC110_g5195 [Phytophthora cactorum]
MRYLPNSHNQITRIISSIPTLLYSAVVLVMQRRLCISTVQHVVVVIQSTVWCQAQVVASECWTNSNGDEICSSDPTGLRATWWFFFVLLLFASAASGCFDADWWPQDKTAQEAAAAGLESGLLGDDKGLSVSLVQPLLDEHEAVKTQQAMSSPLKPVYRYLDP